MKPLILLSMLLSLAACASSPLRLDGVNRQITPEMVFQNSALIGKRVIWGGRIIKTQLLAKTTRIEVLAYPLDNDGWPEFGQPSLGRFMINHRGFLEPTEFSRGRHVTVVGRVGNLLDGHVGGAPYQFPVIHAQQIQLWPRAHHQHPHFHFGVGVGIRL